MVRAALTKLIYIPKLNMVDSNVIRSWSIKRGWINILNRIGD